jgi:XRE family transcriptional regulator, aerobic/anaerobic benzoate catabolism transcriptional regulator
MPIPEAAAETLHPELAQRLRTARAKIGMTRKQLAQASDTSERYLARLEAGTGNPSLSVMIALARALDLSVADLMPLGGERDQRRADVIAAVRRLPNDKLETLQAWLAQNASLGGTKAKRIVLIGLRGAGKSSLGARLAERIGYPFFEISKEVEKVYGAGMRLLIEFGGQGAVRHYESEVWEKIVSDYDRAIIAAPGGIVADETLYSRVLETAHSIWLEASPEDHMARVVKQGDLRPMTANLAAMEDLRSILEARSAEYGRTEKRFNTSRQDFGTSVGLLENEARELLLRS